MGLVDNRQLSRIQAAGPLPFVPPEPNLADAYKASQKQGLTKVFEDYDRERASWREKLGQMLRRLTEPRQTTSTSTGDPRVLWRRYVRSGENSWDLVGSAGYENTNLFTSASLYISTAGAPLDLEGGSSETLTFTVPVSLQGYTLRITLEPAFDQPGAAYAYPPVYQKLRRYIADTPGNTSITYVTWLVTDDEAAKKDSDGEFPGIKIGAFYYELI